MTKNQTAELQKALAEIAKARQLADKSGPFELVNSLIDANEAILNALEKE